MLAKIMRAEAEAEDLRGRLLTARASRGDPERQAARPDRRLLLKPLGGGGSEARPQDRSTSPRALPADIRRKYIEKLEKLASAALGDDAAASKFGRGRGLPPKGASGPPKAAVFQSRADLKGGGGKLLASPARPGTAPTFDSRKLPIRPVLTSSDMAELQAAGQRGLLVLKRMT